MADINNVTLQAGSSPTVNYTITYSKSRPNNSQMTYNFSISCALGSSGSYIGTGYALLCTMTVNGSSGQVRIKSNDNDNWEGTAPRVKTVSVTCSSTTGNAAQGVRFQVVSDGRLTLTSGVIDNSSYTVTSSALITTACGAPSACSVSAALSEGNVTLSWSGASSGTNNSVTGYEIQYSESSNNSSWGSWTALTTVSSTGASGSLSVAPPSTRGYYRRFQVRTQGSAGSGYYSGWSVSSNSVRRNTPPVQPSTVTAAPSTYSNEDITLSWSGASGGTSTIKGYQIASRTSTDNATWGSWSVLTTLILSAGSGSYTPVVSRTPGTYTQFGVWTIDALSVYSSEKVSNSIFCSITACTAPSAFTISDTVAEGNVTLSWSGASGGAGNAITAYEIQYSESADNTAWGDWAALTVIISTSANGTVSAAPSNTRGNYRRFQIRTRGAAGADYYSPWAVSGGSVRKNILPVPPTAFTASPAIYTGTSVSLAWSGTVAGTSAIKQYVIQQSSSTDSVNWGAWESTAVVVSSDTSGTYEAAASAVAGTYTRYRISVTDVLNAISSYVTGNAVKRNTNPPAPAITAPKAGSVTYNRSPRFLIQTGTEADGQAQTVYVQGTSGVWFNSVSNPANFSFRGALGSNVKTVFKNPDANPAQYTVAFECHDANSSSPQVTRTFTIAPSPFEPITANVTHVKAAHILVLRSAVNSVRNYYGLPLYSWSDDVTGGVSQVRDWPYHILEIRAALDPVVQFINSFDPLNTAFDVPAFDWLPLGNGRPRADVMKQIYDLILAL